MKTKTYRILAVVLIIQLIIFLACAGWLFYDSHVDRSGWVEKDGVRIYRDYHARPVSGWLKLEDGWYYLSDDGVPATGWLAWGDGNYYLGDNGIMRTGWQEVSGNTYYLGNNGVMVCGWMELDGCKYYLPDGILVTGWQEINGQTFYFDETGAMYTGFLNDGGSIYYLSEDGNPLTGDVTIGNDRYLFSEDGVMYTGWLDSDDGTRRFYNADGAMASGWQQVEDKWYCFGDDGYAKTGWYQEGEYSYYFHEDGAAAVGPTEIDGQTHYFSPRGIEVVLVNAANPVPEYYKRDLVTVVDWHQVDRRCYDALMKMLSDCEAAGNEYIFNSGYRTVKEQTEILEKRTKEHMEKYKLSFEDAQEKALETVAIPGTSEHHLGLAVDILGDEAIAWLTEHCWDYGFILRYTAEKEPVTGIIDEPWHFRYVGTAVSLDMKDSGLCLEEYLGAA